MKGFSLIELLVVVIIIGLLSAIALPLWLTQANKAKTAEAYTTLRAANQAQLLYFLQHNAFATNANDLQAGIALESPNYVYAVTGSVTAGDTEAHPKGWLVPGFRGCVFAQPTDKPAIEAGGLGQSPPPCE